MIENKPTSLQSKFAGFEFFAGGTNGFRLIYRNASGKRRAMPIDDDDFLAWLRMVRLAMRVQREGGQ